MGKTYGGVLENPKIGLVGYTNLGSGIGIFIWELLKYLKADSILSIGNKAKGQDRWIDRQLMSQRPPNDVIIKRYLEMYRPDVVLFMETPFSRALFTEAKKAGIKTIAIPMHETISASRLNPADLMICTCKEAWRKATHVNRKMLFLPIGLGLFKYRNRKGHRFVTNIGYGGVNDRRQSVKIIKAFEQVKSPKARLTVRCQHEFPQKCESNDKRIEFICKNYRHPAEIYEKGDISILPIAYGGYERSILESMASGMPCVTMDADPMNQYQHNPDFLMKPARVYKLSQQWVVDTHYNEVSIPELTKKLEWLLTINTSKYSKEARRQAVAQSWESEEIDYKSTWLNTIRELC